MRTNRPITKPWSRMGPMAWLCLLLAMSGCVTTAYQPLEATSAREFTQLSDREFEVRYAVGAMTSQQALDDFLLRRCAELTLQQGYDYFEMGERFDSLMFTRSATVLLRMHHGAIPEGATLFHDAHALALSPGPMPPE